MPFQTGNGSVPVVYSLRVLLSDQRISPPRPNPRHRNRRNRPRYTEMTTKRMIITSGMMIRRTNRVTEAKRGRVRVGRVARPNGSGKWCVYLLPHSPQNRFLCVSEGFRCGPARCPFIRPPDRPFPTDSFSDFNFLPTHVLLVGPSWVPSRVVKMPLHQALFSFPFRIYLPYTPCQPSSSSLSLPQSFRYVGFLELLSCIYIPANVKPVHNVINPSTHLHESCNGVQARVPASGSV